MTQRPQHGDVGFVLDIDPDLGAALPEEERTAAREACRGRMLALSTGRCELDTLMGEAAHLVGFLIADGLVCTESQLRDRHLIELLGPGDVLHVTAPDELPEMVGAPATTVLSDTLLVGLGATFIRAAAQWPPLLTAVLARVERQRRRLATQALILHLPQAKHRLLLMMWHLSSRWGHVTPEGVHVPLRLTHDLLGQLIAARRPTVTLAVRELEAEGHLKRQRDGTWVLTDHSRSEVDEIAAADDSPALAETLLAHQQAGDLVRDGRALRGGHLPRAGSPG